MTTLPPNQRMFHGGIRAVALADQLAARFNERNRRVKIERHDASAVVQIGSQHGTPITAHIADIKGGVMVTLGRERDWLETSGDVSELVFKQAASGNPLALFSLVPDVLKEMQKENLAPQIWDAINDLCALSRSLAGEKNAPKNPKVCPFCNTVNDPELEKCSSCGGALPADLPRACPKCGRGHTSDALFCQACGTRLVTG